tara:strand:- start:11081 stop:11524 length:444 start_codon:yes stop_codon:yes gene_type:complete
MNSYTQLLYHIIFGTKYRRPTLIKSDRLILYKYISGLLKKKRCHLYRINGVEDHIHILTHVHPTIPLSTLVKDIKLASHSFIKQQGILPGFKGWQKGYGAFTVHNNDKHRVIAYIKNQEAHHGRITWDEEMGKLYEEHGIEPGLHPG